MFSPDAYIKKPNISKKRYQQYKYPSKYSKHALLEFLNLIKNIFVEIPGFTFDIYALSKIVEVLNPFVPGYLICECEDKDREDFVRFKNSSYWEDLDKYLEKCPSIRYPYSPFAYGFNHDNNLDNSHMGIKNAFLSQAPTSEELKPHLMNLWEREMLTVVCLAENGVTSYVSSDLFDETKPGQGVMVFDDIIVKTTKLVIHTLPNLATYEDDITGEEKTVTQELWEFTITITIGTKIHEMTFYQFKNWQDNKAIDPENLKELVNIIWGNVSTNAFHMHCSGGIGRAGSVLVALCLKELAGQENKPSVLDIIFLLRHFRSGLVQNFDQYDMLLKYEKLLEQSFNQISNVVETSI